MILRIDIHRYTDKNASVLSLKKNKKQKQRNPKAKQTKERPFDLFMIFLLTVTSF